jgi:DNA-binding transcriptional LysR family regulator
MDAIHNLQSWMLVEKLLDGDGFAGASVALDKDLPACSRAVRQLEDALGFKLIDHRRRPAQLTEEALRLAPQIRVLAGSFRELAAGIDAERRKDAEITLSIPVNMARSSFRTSIQAYLRDKQNFRVKVVSDLDHQDILEGKADIACLPYLPPSENLFIWKSYEAVNAITATPSYLQKYGVPASPADLANHAVILRSDRHYPVTQALFKDGESVPLRFKKVAFAGDVLSGREALLAGEGLSIDLSVSSLEEDLKKGSLKVVLPGWHRPAWQIVFAVRRESLSNTSLVDFAKFLVSREARAAAIRIARQKLLLEANTAL